MGGCIASRNPEVRAHGVRRKSGGDPWDPRLALESASSRCVTLLAPLCLPPENGDRQDRRPLTWNERRTVALPYARNPALGGDVGEQADKRGREYKAVSEDSLALKVDPAVELREPLEPLLLEKLTLPKADQRRVGGSRHGAERPPVWSRVTFWTCAHQCRHARRKVRSQPRGRASRPRASSNRGRPNGFVTSRSHSGIGPHTGLRVH
jgi:hypothetical protein